MESRALTEGRVFVTYWDRHSGHEHAARVELIDEFNRSQSEIYVRPVPIGYFASMEKILTSTAGGAPPDICSLDSPILAQLAPQGIFMPLDDFMASSPHLQKEAFYPHVWDSVSHGGHIWGVPTTNDTYCLIWNKTLFRKAGLDPERPPRTLAELEDYAARLTVRDARGNIERMGFVPWLPWDLTHMWGALFGSDWFDPDTGRVRIAEDPAAIASFAWLQNFVRNPVTGEGPAYAMDARDVPAYSEGARTYMSANNAFYAGKVAMITEGEWQSTFVPKYAPGLDWGVAPLPRVPGVPETGYAPACVADVIPVTARNAAAAKKFLLWFHSPRPGGGTSPASDYNFAIHNIPTRVEDTRQERFTSNPKFKVFVDQLSMPRVATYPAIPVTQFLLDELVRQRELVVYHKTTPEQAVRRIETVVNRELGRVTELLERRPT